MNTINKVFQDIPVGRTSAEKPRKEWIDDVENDLKKIDVRGSRKIAKDTDAWKLIMKEARVLHAQQDKWRERGRERECVCVLI